MTTGTCGVCQLPVEYHIGGVCAMGGQPNFAPKIFEVMSENADLRERIARLEEKWEASNGKGK